NLDLVGTGDDGIAVVNAILHEREFNTLNRLNSENQYFSTIKKRGEAANSDHYFFHVKGVKSFFIYTMGGTKAYHDVNDKASDLPLTKYTELYKLIIDFVAAL
ncbi:MAG TPA: M28 family peptidase, partial [Cytophagales bacterium]|nr:M28 family peptidase [Cytophagales bacterium]